MKKILFFTLLLLISCSEEQRISSLLNSPDADDVIDGANKAALTQDEKYVPLLLKNAEDYNISTTLFHKGTSVYEAKMEALQRILHKEPPIEIGKFPDTTVINFYTAIARSRNLVNTKQ